MVLPEIVSREEWRRAREELLAEEKALTRARDALNAQRRRLPMVEVGKEYVFEGGDGKATLHDLFEGRHQLVVYHFVFAPEADAGRRGCAAFLDQIGHLAHLHARGTTFAAVSRAPDPQILAPQAGLRAGRSNPLPCSSSGRCGDGRARRARIPGRARLCAPGRRRRAARRRRRRSRCARWRW
ncbi:hypothetical protein SGLAM104S_09070 [Streptomyces glaucescens]